MVGPDARAVAVGAGAIGRASGADGIASAGVVCLTELACVRVVPAGSAAHEDEEQRPCGERSDQACHAATLGRTRDGQAPRFLSAFASRFPSGPWAAYVGCT